MKILYVKNGSHRDKKFQLQTIIYEDNGTKFVKKVALYDEALPHLHNMKINYTKLSSLIINQKVKLANIIAQDKRSITFEYIEGKSIQTPSNKNEVATFIQEYFTFFKKSFKTKLFDSKKLSPEMIKVFGDFDYSVFNGQLCFQGYTNIDLIYSNIIVKDDEFYIIDYEWVFDFELPIDYILFRNIYSDIKTFDYVKHFFNETYINMELTFSNNYVCNNSFCEYQKKYLHKKYTINQQIHDRDQQIHDRDQQIKTKDLEIHDRDQQIKTNNQQIHNRDQDLEKYDLLKDEYTTMYLSISWKITRFLRKLKRLIK